MPKALTIRKGERNSQKQNAEALTIGKTTTKMSDSKMP